MICGVVSVDNEEIINVDKSDFIEKVNKINDLYKIDKLYMYSKSKVLQTCAKYLCDMKNKFPFEVIGFYKYNNLSKINYRCLFDKIIKTQKNMYLKCDVLLVVHKNYTEIQV